MNLSVLVLWKVYIHKSLIWNGHPNTGNQESHVHSFYTLRRHSICYIVLFRSKINTEEMIKANHALTTPSLTSPFSLPSPGYILENIFSCIIFLLSVNNYMPYLTEKGWCDLKSKKKIQWTHNDRITNLKLLSQSILKYIYLWLVKLSIIIGKYYS